MIRAIVGANWGDEGKGKITDMFAAKSDIVIRFQGGANAGHTIINEHGRFAFHLMPSGVCYDHTTCIIGNGVALDINKFITELEDVKAAGVNELFDEEALRIKLENICTLKNLVLEHVYHKPLLHVDDLFATCMEYRDKIAPYVCDTHAYLQKAVQEGKNILLEGQLGTLKDPDFGIYPMVTSSSTLAGYGAVGAGLPPHKIEDIVVVTKAYSSAVGAGEFVSEILDEDKAQELRVHGGDKGEFGATTGRPRRVGWFDCVATRYGVECQGATQVVMTALDCLSYLEEIPVCVGYEVDGKVIKDFPVTHILKDCKPVLKTLKGWHCNIRGIQNFEDLPQEAKDYVAFIEQEIGHKITMVSNGPEREAILPRA